MLGSTSAGEDAVKIEILAALAEAIRNWKAVEVTEILSSKTDSISPIVKEVADKYEIAHKETEARQDSIIKSDNVIVITSREFPHLEASIKKLKKGLIVRMINV